MTLKHLIGSSENPRHDLSSWLRVKFQEVSKIPISNEESLDLLKNIYNELTEFLRYLTTIEDTLKIESHNISLLCSQLMCATLLRMPDQNSGMIYDTAELLTNIIAEENVLINEDNYQKENKKKSHSKKNYTYKFQKGIASVMLAQMFEIFSKDIHSLIPTLLTTIFKNIKKTIQKGKHFHATYVVSQIKLLRSILRNTHPDLMDASFFSKFPKLSKYVFEEMNNNDIDYPVEFIATLIDCWTFIFKQESFIKDHEEDITSTIYHKFWTSEIAIYGVSNDNTRIYTSRALAEIMFDYQYSKHRISLDEALELYVKIFRHSKSRDIKVGCFESIVHFITLNHLSDNLWLQECRYLHIIQKLSNIFAPRATCNKKAGTISRWIKYFKFLHQLILPYISESSKNQILLTLLGLRSEESDVENSDDFMHLSVKEQKIGINQWFTILQLDLIEQLLSSLSSFFLIDDEMRDKVRQLLTVLSTSDLYVVRLHSIRVLKTFLTASPCLLMPVIQESLETLSNSFENKEKTYLPFAQLHGHALIIATLIDITDKDNVPYELIMRITVFATSFVKNYTTSTTGNLYFKGLICWILLVGLMNYNDEQYLSLQRAQLFLFWKVLLTHSFSYRNDEELYRNLKIRTHALTCLLNFLNNSEIEKGVSVQVSYLLTKCSNFNHSVNLKSNRIDDALLENETRIIQIYLKLQEHIKSDFNSSLLLLIMKNFSDPNLYITPPSGLMEVVNKLKKNPKNEDTEKEKVVAYNIDSILRLEDDFAYGISSKIHSSYILNLALTDFEETYLPLPGLWEQDSDVWYSVYENDVTSPISNMLSNDSLVLLFSKRSYAKGTLFMPKVTTSLIDFSMELFSSVFPFLNSKIQYSLIENLNLSLFSRATTLLRSLTVAANICTALHDTLHIIESNNLPLDASVGRLIIESLRKIEFQNDTYLTCLKANCIGLISAAVRRNLDNNSSIEYIDDQCNILVKSLADKEEPYSRMLNILVLSSVYRYNSKFIRPDNIFDVLITMTKDPHPVIHSWSLKSLGMLTEKHTSISLVLLSTLLSSLEDYLISPIYGIFGASTLRHNYNIRFNSHHMIAQIVETSIENIGPNLVVLESEVVNSFQNICLNLVLSSDIQQQLTSLKIYENIATFKIENVVEDMIFINLAQNIMQSSLVVGIGSSYFDTTFTGSRELIPRTSSLTVASECFQLFEQLFKLKKGSLFSKSMENISWRYLALYPDLPAIKSYFREWLSQTYADVKWFEKLQQIYEMTNAKLFKSFFVNNTQILIDRGVKILAEQDIYSEEEEHIKEIHGSNLDTQEVELLDAVQWRTKEVILSLIASLFMHYHLNQNSDPIVKNVSNLIRLSLQATTTNIESIKKLGLSILHLILKTVAPVRDAEFPERSILEQHEAEITSALMPVFHSAGSPDVIAMAINVGAEILYSDVIPSTRSNRLFHLMVKLLESLNADENNISIGDISIVTKTARRKIELAVLNGWAKLIQYAITRNDEILIDCTKEYWDLLTPFWMISLREYVILNYEGTKAHRNEILVDEGSHIEFKTTKLELYEPVWLNFIKVLSSIIYVDKDMLLKFMNDDELDSFIFTLSTRCLDETLRNIDNPHVKAELLTTVHGIFRCNILQRSLFLDDIFFEVIGIFNRLILTGTIEEKSLVVDIINDLIKDYLTMNSNHEKFLADIDKLYELLKLLMFITSDILPFVKISDINSTISQEILLSEEDQCILRKIVKVFERNINEFDAIFKIDLYTCQLFVIGRIYAAKSVNHILPIFFPLLKTITSDLCKNTEYKNLLKIFYDSIADQLSNLNDENRVTTFLILLTNGFDFFQSAELVDNTNHMFDLLNKKDAIPIIIQGLKRILVNYNELKQCKIVFKNFLLNIFKNFILETSCIGDIFDILVQFTHLIQSSKGAKTPYCFSLCLLFIGKYSSQLTEVNLHIRTKIAELVRIDPDAFKESFSNISETQLGIIIKDFIEGNNYSGSVIDHPNDLNLKSFE